LLHQGGRAIWWIPALVALWVNLDAWFFLGPLVVLVFLIGGIREGHFGSLFLVLLLSLLASLASPHHIHVWRSWPPECDFSLRQGLLFHDARFQGLFTPGWHLPALIQSSPDNLSLWASAFLFLFGALGLLLNPTRLFSSSGLVWLVFAGLAAFNIRLIPFFAVVGTPIVVRCWGIILSREALPLSGPVLVTLANLLLIGLGVPGWLQGMDRRDRALGWSLERNPSLELAAQTALSHRVENRDSKSGRLFPTHPDAAHYLSWFAPSEKTFVDSRWPLFEGVLPDFEKICQGLGLPGASNLPDCTREEWEALLEKWQIDGILLWDPEPRRLQAALQAIRSIHVGWRIREITGRAFLMERDQGSTPEWSPVDRTPSPEALKPLQTLPARSIWDVWAKPGSGPSLESENAAGILRLFEANRQSDLGEKRDRAGALLASSLVSGQFTGPVQSLALLLFDARFGHSS
ncbi:MAG: hypothetical protein ACKO23_10470, partial [Gemmataceae bacterium]